MKDRAADAADDNDDSPARADGGRRRNLLVAVGVSLLFVAAGVALYLQRGDLGDGGGRSSVINPEFESLTPQQQEQRLDDLERARRAARGGVMRRLPGDPPESAAGNVDQLRPGDRAKFGKK